MCLLSAMSGCWVSLPKYREFTRSIDFDRLESYRIEGPLLPGGFENRLRIAGYEEAILAVIDEEMEAREFRKADGLADADIVLEWYWISGKQLVGSSLATASETGPSKQAYLRLGLRIFDSLSGEVFWRNTASQGVAETFLTEFSVTEMARQTLSPFPRKAETGVFVGRVP